MKTFAVAAVMALGFVSMSGAFMKGNATMNSANTGFTAVNDTVVDTTKQKVEPAFALSDTVVPDTNKTSEPAFALADTIVTDTTKA